MLRATCLRTLTICALFSRAAALVSFVPVAPVLGARASFVTEVVLTALVSGSVVKSAVAFVSARVAGGMTLDTNRTMNASICSSPSFLRNVLVTLITTASIGTNASKLTYASAEARTGQRFRLKLFQTSTQKCANLCSPVSGRSERNTLSSQILWASLSHRLNFEKAAAIFASRTLTKRGAKSNSRVGGRYIQRAPAQISLVQ